ncbi:MAG: hypothetical protein QXR58_02035 [Candidatus Micrarchaeaceae archaeon]
MADREIFRELPEKAHKLQEFSSLRVGSYKIEALYRYIAPTNQAMSINGTKLRLAIDEIYFVLSKSGSKGTSIYTAFMDNDIYINNYLNAFYRMAGGNRILKINDSERNVDKSKSLFPTRSTAMLLSRLDEAQSYLLPGNEYIVEGTSISNGIVNIQLSFLNSEKIQRIMMSVFVEPGNLQKHDTRPYEMRLRNFYENRKGLSLSVSEPMPVILNGTNFSDLVSKFHSNEEKPVFEKGKVYVLDDVEARGDHLVYLRYHPFFSDSRLSQLLRRDQTTITMEDVLQIESIQRTLTIATFKDEFKGEGGRTQSEVNEFFKEKLERGCTLFSTFEDIYANSMDYMKVPSENQNDMPNPLIFKYYPDTLTDKSGEKLMENVNILVKTALQRSYKIRVGNQIISFPHRVP